MVQMTDMAAVKDETQSNSFRGITAASMDMQQLGNLIFKIKKLVRLTKSQVHRKLVHQELNLKKKLEMINNKTRNGGAAHPKLANIHKKLDRLKKQIWLVKAVDPSKVARFALANEESFDKVSCIPEQSENLTLLVLLRLTSHPILDTFIKEWRAKHHDWKTLARSMELKSVPRRFKNNEQRHFVTEKSLAVDSEILFHGLGLKKNESDISLRSFAVVMPRPVENIGEYHEKIYKETRRAAQVSDPRDYLEYIPQGTRRPQAEWDERVPGIDEAIKSRWRGLDLDADEALQLRLLGVERDAAETSGPSPSKDNYKKVDLSRRTVGEDDSSSSEIDEAKSGATDKDEITESAKPQPDSLQSELLPSYLNIAEDDVPTLSNLQLEREASPVRSSILVDAKSIDLANKLFSGKGKLNFSNSKVTTRSTPQEHTDQEPKAEPPSNSKTKQKVKKAKMGSANKIPIPFESEAEPRGGETNSRSNTRRSAAVEPAMVLSRDEKPGNLADRLRTLAGGSQPQHNEPNIKGKAKKTKKESRDEIPVRRERKIPSHEDADFDADTLRRDTSVELKAASRAAPGRLVGFQPATVRNRNEKPSNLAEKLLALAASGRTTREDLSRDLTVEESAENPEITFTRPPSTFQPEFTSWRKLGNAAIEPEQDVNIASGEMFISKLDVQSLSKSQRSTIGVGAQLAQAPSKSTDMKRVPKSSFFMEGEGVVIDQSLDISKDEQDRARKNLKDRNFKGVTARESRWLEETFESNLRKEPVTHPKRQPKVQEAAVPTNSAPSENDPVKLSDKMSQLATQKFVRPKRQAEPKKPQKKADGPVHPSWEAAKRQRALAAAAPKSKRIKFDDSD